GPAGGAAQSGSNTVALGRGLIVTALAVSTHCVGMVVGSCAYCAQLGVGTAVPIQSSWVSALASPGAPSAAEYSAVGGRLRKSPTPPRRMPRGNARAPPPDSAAYVHVKPIRGAACTSPGMRSVRTPNSESRVRL